MSKTYYDAADLRKFGKITEWSEELGNKFFDYYGKVFEEGALTAREKSLIALAVAHTEQCPYCIDAYTKDGLPISPEWLISDLWPLLRMGAFFHTVFEIYAKRD